MVGVAPPNPGRLGEAYPVASPQRTGTRRRRRRSPTWGGLLVLAGAATALWAQRLVALHASGASVAAVYALAAALFVTGLWLTPDTRLLRPRPLPSTAARPSAAGPPAGTGSAGVAGRPARRITGVRGRPFLASLALGGLTFVASGGNQFGALNLTTWLASIVLALAACWQWRTLPPWERWQARGMATRARWNGVLLRGAGWVGIDAPGPPALRLTWPGLTLLAIVAVGAVLLFYRLGAVPSEMQSDHAEKLLDVRDVLDGQWHVFFPRNTGREALQFYWAALLSPLTGVSYLGLKIGTALLACVTIPFAFLFARELVGTWPGLLTAGLLATSRWHLLVGRRGLRFPFPPLFGAAIYFFLFRALRNRRRNDFLLCGLVLGVGLHTYIPLRAAPIGVAICLAMALALDVWRRVPPVRVWRLATDSVLLFVVTGLVFMPLARYAFDNPASFLFRGVSRITGDAGSSAPAGALAVFWQNVVNAVLMFNWRGDSAWVNNIQYEPFLEPVTAAAFALGCCYALYRLVRYRETPFLYVFVLIFVGLLPSTLSIAFPVENPATARTGLALPLAMFLATCSAVIVARSLASWLGGRWGGALAAACLVPIGLYVVAANVDQYFHTYDRQFRQYSQQISPIAQAIRGFLEMGGERQDVHILPWAHWVDTRSVASEALGDVRWPIEIENAAAARRQDGVPRSRLYVLNPEDRPSLDLLRRMYPTALVETHRLPHLGNQPYFVTVIVPPDAAAAA